MEGSKKTSGAACLIRPPLRLTFAWSPEDPMASLSSATAT